MTLEKKIKVIQDGLLVVHDYIPPLLFLTGIAQCFPSYVLCTRS